MDLRTYFEDHPQVELARALNVTPGAVNQWVNGLTKITEGRCIQIEAATNGLVRCEDLRPDVRWDVLRANPSCARAATAQAATEAVAGGHQ